MLRQKIKRFLFTIASGTYTWFAVFSFVFVYFCSRSTSPLYPFFYGADSAQFQTIGRAWVQGILPYIQIFDHKGPFIFFVDMLGFCLTGSSTGILFIQAVSLFITLITFLRMAQKVSSSRSYGFLAVLLALCAFCMPYNTEGNYTEEYCLPFISICTCLHMEYLFLPDPKEKLSHRPLHAFIYGVSFGICLLTRVTNGITICAGTLIIACLLLIQKNHKNLFMNALSLTAGFLCVVLPFTLYFAVHGGLGDFLYGTLFYNIEYQQHMTSWVISDPTIGSWLTYIGNFFTSYIIFIVAALALRRHNIVLSLYCLLCGLLEVYLYFSGALYTHYVIISLPQFIIFFNEIHLINKEKRSGRFIRNIFLCLTVIYCLFSFGTMARNVVGKALSSHHKDPVGYEQLLDMVPDEEKPLLVAYGDNGLRELYLLLDITPRYKYFALQEWHAGFSEQTREDIRKVFAEGDAGWILSAGPTTVIGDILDHRYVFVAESGDYKLYRLKEGGS